MVQDGQSKRRLGDIWAHLVVSTCVLLVPPFVMAAGVMYLGSPSPQGPEQQVAERANMERELAGSEQVLIRKKDQGGRGVFYAAQVGPLARDEANGLCSRIKSAGGKCLTLEN